jgi:hypothetical protein
LCQKAKSLHRRLLWMLKFWMEKMCLFCFGDEPHDDHFDAVLPIAE